MKLTLCNHSLNVRNCVIRISFLEQPFLSCLFWETYWTSNCYLWWWGNSLHQWESQKGTIHVNLDTCICLWHVSCKYPHRLWVMPLSMIVFTTACSLIGSNLIPTGIAKLGFPLPWLTSAWMQKMFPRKTLHATNILHGFCLDLSLWYCPIWQEFQQHGRSWSKLRF